MGMKIRFWGVRGSIASPGPETAGVGGNTSSVELECGQQRILLDAGTGLRQLGEELVRQGVDSATLLVSHHHWDHIQGLPFFVPLYMPGTRLSVMGPSTERLGLPEVLSRQMSAPGFPVRFDELPSAVDTRELKNGDRFELGDVRVTVAKLNHPGGVLAYRVDYGGASVVYATDTEHYACVDPVLRELADRADVLIYDAQYTPEEYRGESGPSKAGWGHSTFEEGARLARVSNVGRLVLFHHDPKRADDAVAELEERAQKRFVDTMAAREGMIMELDAASSAA